jgi:oligoendopeptidase F
VGRRNDIPQRWYRLKAQLLGLDRLADYDRMASVASAEEEFGWSEAREREEIALVEACFPEH